MFCDGHTDGIKMNLRSKHLPITWNKGKYAEKVLWEKKTTAGLIGHWIIEMAQNEMANTSHHNAAHSFTAPKKKIVIYCNAMLVSNGFLFYETDEFTQRTVKHQNQRNIPETHDIWDANQKLTTIIIIICKHWMPNNAMNGERKKNRKWFHTLMK